MSIGSRSASASDDGADARRAPRPAARILLTDSAGRVLLFRFDPPGRPPFWCTPGGALEPGETYEAAARRELLEETGFDLDPGPVVARRIADFETIEGMAVRADERYFRVRAPSATIDVSGHTPLERAVMREWRWFTPASLAALGELFFPADIFAMLGACAAGDPEGGSR